MSYDDFVDWKNKKNTAVEGHVPYKSFSSSEKNFAEYLIYLVTQSEKFQKMMTEIGDKRTVFEQVYFYLKDTKDGLDELPG